LRKRAHSGAREIPFKLGGSRFMLAPREAVLSIYAGFP
jgi:hypothetical protein